jgi:hypothetical protein
MTMKFMALALLTFAGAASVYAQGVAFNATSLPRGMRQEGITEAAGEITLTAINGGTVLAGSSIDVVYSVAVTNNSTASTANISRANNVFCAPSDPLVVDFGDQCINANLVASLTGSQTVRISFLNNITFAPNDQITISRVRVNASAAVGVGSVTATMSGTSANPATNPITFTDAQRQVGVLNPTISVRYNSSTAPVTFLQTCIFPNDTVSNAANRFRIRVDEVFPAALTTLAQETTASGFLAPTNGTIVRVSLAGVPAGVTVTAPAAQVGTLPDDVTATALTLTLSGTSSAVVDQTVAGAPITFDYLTTASDTSQVERVLLTFFFKATTTSSTNPIALPSLGGSVNVQATVSVQPVTSTDSTIVRFVANGIGPTTVATVSDCNTRILMTWVATVADVETGIAISNTSSDDAAFGAGAASGATAQNGTCTLTGYPSAGGTPVSFTTATINAGASLPFLLSATTGFSNFTGYVLTVCNFQTAHAFTFITNGRGTVTGPTLAQGYVANIIPGGTRPLAGN